MSVFDSPMMVLPPCAMTWMSIPLVDGETNFGRRAPALGVPDFPPRMIVARAVCSDDDDALSTGRGASELPPPPPQPANRIKAAVHAATALRKNDPFPRTRGSKRAPDSRPRDISYSPGYGIRGNGRGTDREPFYRPRRREP